jgi:hypothetical protein
MIVSGTTDVDVQDQRAVWIALSFVFEPVLDDGGDALVGQGADLDGVA